MDERLAKIKDWIKFIPGWVPANLITILRGLMLIPIYLAYRGDILWLVFILFLLAWFTDILDGMHARYRNQIDTLGKRLDPAVDKIFVVGLLWMLAPGRLSWGVIGATIGVEILIAVMAGIAAPLAARFWHRRFKVGANVYGKIKMFLQGSGLVILILGLNTRALQVFSEVLFWSALVFACVSVFFYLRAFEKMEQVDND